MPRRPLAGCNHPGCRALVEAGSGQCPAHKRAQQRVRDRDRPSPAVRGYGRNHQRLRLIVMAEQPLCLTCQAAGRIELGTEMDHIDGNVNNLSRDNLQMLCKGCHSHKTAKEQGGLGGSG